MILKAFDYSSIYKQSGPDCPVHRRSLFSKKFLQFQTISEHSRGSFISVRFCSFLGLPHSQLLINIPEGEKGKISFQNLKFRFPLCSALHTALRSNLPLLCPPVLGEL